MRAVGFQVRRKLGIRELGEPLVDKGRVRRSALAQAGELVVDAEISQRRIEGVAGAGRARIVARRQETAAHRVRGLLVRWAGPPAAEAHRALGHRLGGRGHEPERQGARPREYDAARDHSHHQRGNGALAADLQRGPIGGQAPVAVVFREPRDPPFRTAQPDIRHERTGQLPTAHLARVPDLSVGVGLAGLRVKHLPPRAAVVPQQTLAVGDAAGVVKPQQIGDRMHQPRLIGLQRDDQLHRVQPLAARAKMQNDLHHPVVVEGELGASHDRPGRPRAAPLDAIGRLLGQCEALSGGNMRLALRFNFQSHGRGQQLVPLADGLPPESRAIQVMAAEHGTDARRVLGRNQRGKRWNHHPILPEATLLPGEVLALERPPKLAARSVPGDKPQHDFVRPVAQRRHGHRLAGVGHGQLPRAPGQDFASALGRKRHFPVHELPGRPQQQQPKPIKRWEITEPELQAIGFHQQALWVRDGPGRRPRRIGLRRGNAG